MSERDELDQQLERLGDAVAPGESIVDSVMRRIETTTTAPARPARTEIKGHPMMRSRTFRWLLPLAAAAAVIAAVGFWPSHTNRHNRQRNWCGPTSSPTCNRSKRSCAGPRLYRPRECARNRHSGTYTRKTYVLDGGVSRNEDYGVPSSQPAARNGPPQPNFIDIRTPELDVQWNPNEQRAYRFGIPGAIGRGALRSLDVLANLQRIGADQTRKVGDELHAGVETAVFEAPIEAQFDAGRAPPNLQARARLGLKATAVPTKIEMRFTESGDVEFIVDGDRLRHSVGIRLCRPICSRRGI